MVALNEVDRREYVIGSEKTTLKAQNKKITFLCRAKVKCARYFAICFRRIARSVV